MDVLSPELVWIENRCYRVNSTLESQENSQFPKQGGYIEADLESEEEMDPMDYEIQKTGESSFTSSFHVPGIFHGGIIGQRGTTRKRLEMETKCLIQVPNRGSKAPIVVTGQREEDVISVRKKIDDIVLSLRRRNDFTHFLSFPCCTADMKKGFERFKEAVKELEVDGLVDEIFQIPEKLHLTFTIMVLMDDEERKLAKEILQGERDAILAILSDFGGKAEVKIEGLDTMNDNPEKTKVLYAKVHSEALQMIADHLDAVIGSKRLGKEKVKEHVKLHMTLMNSGFAVIDRDGPRRYVPFNATNILRELKDFPFGTLPLTEIHLSQRSAYDDTGYYKATATLKVSE